MKHADDTITVTGILQRIKFYENNYLIGVLSTGISVKGYFNSEPQIGMEYTFYGHQMDHHRLYGKTLRFTEYRSSYPKELDAIRAYIWENCKYIGPEISKKIINTYGKDTLNVCKNDPDRIASEISGLTPDRAFKISAMLRKNEDMEKFELELNKLFRGTGTTKRAIGNIVRMYKDDCISRVKENPYQLIYDVDGIGFLTADRIAARLKISDTDEHRIYSGIIYAIREKGYRQGHTCLPRKKLVYETAKILKIDNDLIREQIDKMIDSGMLLEKYNTIYELHFYEKEKYIADKLLEMMSVVPDTCSPATDGLMDDQIEAVKKIRNNNVFVLSGPAGSGKTTTLKKIIDSFDSARIVLAAPTGRAAKRMYEQTGHEASTIHKLLEPRMTDKNTFEFSKNETDPIAASLIILDETSMISTELMCSFLAAVKTDTRLILVGDPYQIPAVGPGNVLKKILESQAVPAHELSTIKRQDEGLIIRNAHNIKNGRKMNFPEGKDHDMYFIRADSQQMIKKTIMHIVSSRIPERYGYDPVRDIQILSPLKTRTDISCKDFNDACQKMLNDNPAIPKISFKQGDKVMQTKNDYDLDLVNGDIGYIQFINKREKTININFENPDRNVDVPLYDNNIQLAYAISCHKYQGAECPVVVIPIHKSFGNFLTTRNLFYTAVTRASALCVLVGQIDEAWRMIKRDTERKRYTNLDIMLKERN